MMFCKVTRHSDNQLIYIELNEIVEMIPGEKWDVDAVQVNFDSGGCGAVNLHLLEKVEEKEAKEKLLRQAYGGEPLHNNKDFMTSVLGFTEAEAKLIEEETAKNMEGLEEDRMVNEGGLCNSAGEKFTGPEVEFDFKKVTLFIDEGSQLSPGAAEDVKAWMDRKVKIGLAKAEDLKEGSWRERPPLL